VPSRSGYSSYAGVLTHWWTPNTDWLRDHDGWLDETGHVQVDGYLRAGGKSDVFAVGDVNNVPEPKLAQWANAQGKAVAGSIRAVLDGKALGQPAK
jgi:apoptosis-inducing factor 2